MLHNFIRIVLALFTWVAVNFFSYWMFFVQILPFGVAAGGSFVLASATAWLVWRQSGKTGKGGLVRHMVIGAALVGATGFIGGFFGPMLFAPDANQGPLLGLLITGPLGFIAGAAGGAVWWFVRKNRNDG